MALRIHLRVPCAGNDGYGNDGIGLTQALLRRGVDVTLSPEYVYPPIPEDVAMLLTKRPEPPYDALINHVNPVGLKMKEHARKEAYKTFAWSMWEWESFDEEKSALVKDALDDYTHVFAYDDVTARAFESTGTSTPITKFQGGYDPQPWMGNQLRPLAKRDWNAEPFVFVMAGSITIRKDPYVALEALSKLYDKGYNLKFYIKTLTPGSVPHYLKEIYPFLEILEGNWAPEQMRQLYERAHCYLGPSWGEGKNLPALEAGTTGCALILSDVGGHRGWAMEEFATLVSGTTFTYDGPPSLRVDPALLADACQDLMDNRMKARQMGEQASRIIPVTMSWDRVVDKFLSTYL